jgi:gluconate 2-dehydrogenase gamma chain
MHRRQVIRYLGAALALPFLPKSADAAISLGEELHRRLLTEEVPFRTLNQRQRAVVTQIADIVIPKTDAPGANDVQVPEFIDLIATEWMHEDERAAFLAGVDEIDAKGFSTMPSATKVALVAALDKARNDKTGAGHAFGRVKALTVYGYFTSAAVQQDVLKTQVMFDGYHGDVPFAPAT